MRRKYIHAKGEPLEVQCLKDGTLDVLLRDGTVFGKNRKPLKLHKDKDGYWGFWLNRERKGKRGKPERDGKRERYRNRRYVLVHRLVKIKAIAVGLGGLNWRKYVSELPIRGLDVNHTRGKDNNGANYLEIATERANRGKTEMSEAEYRECANF